MKGFRCNECGLDGAGAPKTVIQDRADLSFGEVAVCPDCGSDDIEEGEFSLDEEDPAPLNHQEYEQALAEAHGDADVMLAAAISRIITLERILARLVDTTHAHCPVDHPAFKEALNTLPPGAMAEVQADQNAERRKSAYDTPAEAHIREMTADGYTSGELCVDIKKNRTRKGT